MTAEEVDFWASQPEVGSGRCVCGAPVLPVDLGDGGTYFVCVASGHDLGACPRVGTQEEREAFRRASLSSSRRLGWEVLDDPARLPDYVGAYNEQRCFDVGITRARYFAIRDARLWGPGGEDLGLLSGEADVSTGQQAAEEGPLMRRSKEEVWQHRATVICEDPSRTARERAHALRDKGLRLRSWAGFWEMGVRGGVCCLMAYVVSGEHFGATEEVDYISRPAWMLYEEAVVLLFEDERGQVQAELFRPPQGEAG